MIVANGKPSNIIEHQQEHEALNAVFMTIQFLKNPGVKVQNLKVEQPKIFWSEAISVISLWRHILIFSNTCIH